MDTNTILRLRKTVTTNVNILVVEDSITQAARLRHILEQHQYRARVAHDGEDALPLIAQEVPDIVISDILMPKMGGYELCQRIKQDEQLKSTPVILLTSLSDPEDVIKGLQCGADNFITKPYSSDYLLSRIEYILVNKELRAKASANHAVEIFFCGHKYVITAERVQIIDLLVSSFENAVLKNSELEKTLNQLRAAQNQLITREKIASLGELTAGIAHEIRNPLNFMNNFSALSLNLIQDLALELENLRPSISDERFAGLTEILSNLRLNTQKVTTHGKDADAIVRSMIEHARIDATTITRMDINKLLDEYVKIVCHGKWMADREVQITVVKQYQSMCTDLPVYRQELGRAIFNIVNNACYAVAQRQKQEGANFAAEIVISTRDTDNGVEIRVRDNGSGIAPELKDKVFLPFFTTKPTGEGPGLGLSLSHEIVVKQHNGALTFQSVPDQFCEFIICLPKRLHPASSIWRRTGLELLETSAS